MNILWELFLVFFGIGLFTFGGGYAMIPLIQEEVIQRGWLTGEELLSFLAISEATPGPFAINVATFVGTSQAGPLGAIMATAGVILPSFLIILIIAALFKSFSSNRYVQGFLHGVRPVVVILVLAVAWELFVQKAWDGGHIQWRFLLLFAGLYGIKKKWNPHPILLIIIAAIAGIALYSIGT